MSTAIKIENVSKQYRLGQVGTGTISHDLNRWWARIRGKEDPYSLVGQANQRDKDAQGDYVWVLRDIELDIKQGEVLGIIGANGAGKSTLLKLISRITAPTTGQIKAKGRIASLLEVGTGMHPEMTARENIYLNGAILGMRRHEIKIKLDDILEFAGCRMYADTPVKRFSSGMHVRLGFAVAAFLDPEILIVDEVLAVGDAEFQKRAIGKMREVSQHGGRTVLFVSHNMSSIRQLTTSSVLLERGKVTCHGRTEDVISSYMNMREKEEKVSASDMARPFEGLSGHIFFTSLEARQELVNEGDQAELDIVLECQTAVQHFLFAITIFCSDSTPVGSTFSRPQAAPQIGKRKAYSVKLPVQQFAPGTYYCGISVVDARHERHMMHDSLTDVVPFEIQATSLEKRGWLNGWGAIRLSDMDVQPGVDL